VDNLLCLCNHPEPLHLLTGRCSALGCTCTGYEADVCGLPPTRHSEHVRFEPSCDRCQDLLTEAREVAAEAPWFDDE
jgi:hypothetical protein